MHLVRPLLCMLYLAVPAGAVASQQGPASTAAAMSMDTGASAQAAALKGEAAWTGIFYRCSSERAARRVIAIVKDRRPLRLRLRCQCS